MRFLTSEESAQWCASRGFQLLTYGQGLPYPDLGNLNRLSLIYPTDSGKKVQLAKTVAEWSLRQCETLFWLGDWDVWPSSQHMPLFTRFRAALGETRPLIETPGHLLQCDEVDDGSSILAVALLFFWDCCTLRADGGPAFYCSHDEFCEIATLSDTAELEAAQEFNIWLASGVEESDG
mgnify:CR=1 FL=1